MSPRIGAISTGWRGLGAVGPRGCGRLRRQHALARAFLFFLLNQAEESHPHRGVGGAPTYPPPIIRSRIEPGAVTDAALCRYMPLLAEQEL